MEYEHIYNIPRGLRQPRKMRYFRLISYPISPIDSCGGVGYIDEDVQNLWTWLNPVACHIPVSHITFFIGLHLGANTNERLGELIDFLIHHQGST